MLLEVVKTTIIINLFDLAAWMDLGITVLILFIWGENFDIVGRTQELFQNRVK